MKRFHRIVEGASSVATTLVLAIAIVQLYLVAFVDNASVFGLGDGTKVLLGVTVSALTLVANKLPSIFGSDSGG